MQEELHLRLNELARKKKSLGLTVDEQEEQTKLYRMYTDEMKEQTKKALQDAGIKPKE
jgi:uncharacterized protein YnzC (UPF0291/DUF896 family)